MYLIYFTILCGLTTLLNLATAAVTPLHEPTQRMTGVTNDDHVNGRDDSFPYLISIDESDGATVVPREDFFIAPAGILDVYKDKNGSNPSQTHSISVGTPDLSGQPIQGILDDTGTAVENGSIAREIIHTPLKAGAIKVEVFHLEDEKDDSKEDGLTDRNGTKPVTGEPGIKEAISLLENNNEFPPVASLLEEFRLEEANVENEKEFGGERRKRFLEVLEENDTSLAATLTMSEEVLTSREIIHTKEGSPITSVVNFHVPTIIPRTESKRQTFDRNAENDAGNERNHQIMAFPVVIHDVTSGNENVPAFNSTFSFTHSEQHNENENNLEVKQPELDGEIHPKDEINNSSGENLSQLTNFNQATVVPKTSGMNETEKEAKIEEDKEDYVTNFFGIDKVDQVIQSFLSTMDDLNRYTEDKNDSEERLSETTGSSEIKLEYEDSKQVIKRKRRHEEDGSSLSTVKEDDAYITKIIPKPVDISCIPVDVISQHKYNTSLSNKNISVEESNGDSMQNTEENISSTAETLFNVTEESSTIYIEIDTTTSPTVGEILTTLFVSQENGITTTTEKNFSNEDATNGSGGRITSLTDVETKNTKTTVSPTTHGSHYNIKGKNE